jgi:hypothetical protein
MERIAFGDEALLVLKREKRKVVSYYLLECTYRSLLDRKHLSEKKRKVHQQFKREKRERGEKRGCLRVSPLLSFCFLCNIRPFFSQWQDNDV